MQIRRATAEEMLALWGYEDPDSASPTAALFYDNISSGNTVFWTLDDDGELIGELYAFLDLDDRDFADGHDTAYLCAFRVKEGHRGRGYGSAMMARALDELKQAGFRRATIGVGSNEPRNIRMYERLGFSTKVRDCHYDPCALDDDMKPKYDETVWWLLGKEL